MKELEVEKLKREIRRLKLEILRLERENDKLKRDQKITDFDLRWYKENCTCDR